MWSKIIAPVKQSQTIFNFKWETGKILVPALWIMVLQLIPYKCINLRVMSLMIREGHLINPSGLIFDTIFFLVI